MIVWLASYPRSGNTFLRVVLHRLYGISTYSVYDDDDPVAQRVGPELVGWRPRPADRTQMADVPGVYFVKTHKRRKGDVYPAIYLVRDGRDALVSRARLLATERGGSDSPALYEQLLREQIVRPFVHTEPSSGTWGGNVLSWLESGGALLAVMKYEDLIVDPCGVVQRAVSSLGLDVVANPEARIPMFAELHAINPEFFRRGVPGAWRDEMPEELHELFWSGPENAEGMERAGYA